MLVSMLALETRSSYLPSFQLQASSFDTSFDTDKLARLRRTSFYNWATLAHFRHFPDNQLTKMKL